MIIQLYPNEKNIKLDQYGDEHVYWIRANDEQSALFSSLSWVILNKIDLDNELSLHVDYDIYDEGIGAAMRVANELLQKYQGEVYVI